MLHCAGVGSVDCAYSLRSFASATAVSADDTFATVRGADGQIASEDDEAAKQPSAGHDVFELFAIVVSREHSSQHTEQSATLPIEDCGRGPHLPC